MNTRTSTLQPSLPTTFRWYCREAVNNVLHEAEQGYPHLIAEHDALRSVAKTLEAKVNEVNSELDVRRKRERAVAQASITAHDEAERLITAAHERPEKEAPDLIDAAHAEAERLVREFSEKHHETEVVVHDMTNRLRTLLLTVYRRAAPGSMIKNLEAGKQSEMRLAGP